MQKEHIVCEMYDAETSYPCSFCEQVVQKEHIVCEMYDAETSRTSTSGITAYSLLTGGGHGMEQSSLQTIHQFLRTSKKNMLMCVKTIILA